MTVLDANYILRYLLDDEHSMHLKAKEVIETEACLLLGEVMAEVVYVLTGVYHTPKDVLCQTLMSFTKLETVSMHEPKEIMLMALQHFERKNLDFVDCYLCALKEKYTVKSFDKKLMKCIEDQ